MSRLKRNVTVEPHSSRDYNSQRREGTRIKPLADYKEDWLPHPVDDLSVESDDHTHTVVRGGLEGRRTRPASSRIRFLTYMHESIISYTVLKSIGYK